MQLHEINDYEAQRYRVIRYVEEPGGVVSLEPYVDSAGIATIGAGLNLREPAVVDAILEQFGVAPGSDEGEEAAREIATIAAATYPDTDEGRELLRNRLNAVTRLGGVMDAPAEPYSLTPSRAPGGKGQIDIQGLGFRYADDRPPLYRNLNLTIKPGTAVALTGPSGCGKSTLAKLLQGFYRPTEGRILIDGRDLCNLSANELRAYFGVVPQETQLFSGSVYDNLMAANPHATFEQVVQACQLAEIQETIEALPDGYQTALGERGIGLSGGQKQRLAIARALLKRPQILIFDESTSALDAATAEQFAQTVNKLRGKVTLLFITHQLPSGLHVDGRLELANTGAVAGKKPENEDDQP